MEGPLESLFSSDEDCALTPLLMLLLLQVHLNKKICRIPERPKIILIPFFSPSLPSQLLFKIPM